MNERNSPEYWRVRAAEAQALGDQLSDVGCKQVMYSIAAGYEQMAAIAERYERSDAQQMGSEAAVTRMTPRPSQDRRLS